MSQEWRLHAACRGADPEAPFAGPGTDEENLFVRCYCRLCPVRKECLAFGLKVGGLGIFGGLNATQRGRLCGRTPTRPVTVPKDPQCGTPQGYRRHREVRFEAACPPCKAAWTAYCGEKKRARLGRTA